MAGTSLAYVDGTPLLARAALTGAITALQDSNATSLGSFTKAQLNTAVSDGDVIYVGDTATAATALATSRNFSISGSGITATAVGFTGAANVVLAASVDAGHITLARMADVATSSIFYRKTAGTGAPEVQSLATLKTDLGLTGTNSGDQTSIVGITGTLAQFNTACTDADFLSVANAASLYQPLDTQLTDLAGLSYTGNSLKVIRVNVGETGWELAAANAGDVVGPASATDNAIARFDTTTGKLLQDSLAFVTDDGRLGVGASPAAGFLLDVSATVNATRTAGLANGSTGAGSAMELRLTAGGIGTQFTVNYAGLYLSEQSSGVTTKYCSYDTHIFRNGAGTEELRINSTGALGLAGANYGTAGQVFTSQGPASTPLWTTITGTPISKGSTTVNFGAFPGASDTSVAITGQGGILAGSSVKAWLVATATADHTADEHWVETIEVKVGNIVPGTGFTIYAKNTGTLNEPVSQTWAETRQAGPGAGINQVRPDIGGGRGTRLYGQFTVAWEWI